jgi:hypothetical protein
MAGLSSAPEFLICVDCETPCYDFEWDDGQLGEVICHACGNAEPEMFITEEDFEALSDATDTYKNRGR